MINPLALEITKKLRSIYAHQVRVAELFLKIGQVSDFTPSCTHR